jgi:CAAX prenyl protease-like protein
MAAQHERAWSKLRAWMRGDAFPRILPFALFIAFVAVGLSAHAPAAPGEFDDRWIYAIRAIVAGAACAVLWPKFSELRSGAALDGVDWLAAIAGGAGVLAIWVLLDEGWVTFELTGGFDPRKYGSESIDWPITVMRLAGLALVVPLLEELFWRSFLMRWVVRMDFLTVVPAQAGARALIISSALFALEHKQWLAGLIAGLAYGWLYMRTGKLWVSIIAHAVTNGGLGIYILVTRDWRCW